MIHMMPSNRVQLFFNDHNKKTIYFSWILFAKIWIWKAKWAWSDLRFVLFKSLLILEFTTCVKLMHVYLQVEILHFLHQLCILKAILKVVWYWKMNLISFLIYTYNLDVRLTHCKVFQNNVFEIMCEGHVTSKYKFYKFSVTLV